MARKAAAKVSTKGKGEKHTTESTKKADWFNKYRSTLNIFFCHATINI